jgi:hypothetical protein
MGESKSEPLKAGQDVSCVQYSPRLSWRCVGLNLRLGRWKWGTSNVTGKVDEVVHDGQAQVQSNKVRILVCAVHILGIMLIPPAVFVY